MTSALKKLYLSHLEIGNVLFLSPHFPAVSLIWSVLHTPYSGIHVAFMLALAHWLKWQQCQTDVCLPGSGLGADPSVSASGIGGRLHVSSQATEELHTCIINAFRSSLQKSARWMPDTWSPTSMTLPWARLCLLFQPCPGEVS